MRRIRSRNTALSWLVPVLILLFWLKHTTLVFHNGYNNGDPCVVNVSRKRCDVHPIMSAAAIGQFHILTIMNGINKIIEWP